VIDNSVYTDQLANLCIHAYSSVSDILYYIEYLIISLTDTLNILHAVLPVDVTANNTATLCIFIHYVEIKSGP